MSKRCKYGKSRRLYRNPREGMIGGVCAGIADHFELDTWFVRIIAITALIMLSSFTFIAYIVAWIVLRERPDMLTTDDGKLKSKFSDDLSRKSVLKGCRDRFDVIEARLRNLEAYLTSKRYKLRGEIDRL